MPANNLEGIEPPCLNPIVPIGDTLRMLRKRDGIKLSVVARAVGTTVSTLSAIETSRILNPGFQVVYSLARYYGVPFAALVDGTVPNDESTHRTAALARRLTPYEDKLASSYLQFLIDQRDAT